MTQNSVLNKTWYVERRGTLIAEEFLLELEPDRLSAMPDEKDQLFYFDYLAFFSTNDGTPITIAVIVKAKEQEIRGKFTFPAQEAGSLRRANLPVLIVAIDVKQNLVFFNWIKDAISDEQLRQLKNRASCTIELREATPEEKEKLKHEIFDLAEVPA